MPLCPMCGMSVTDGAEVCDHCGESLRRDLGESHRQEEKLLRRAEPLVSDARLAIFVGLLPILGLIYIVRLVQWYQLQGDVRSLVFPAGDVRAKLVRDFVSARPRFWFAVLFWPALIIGIFLYIGISEAIRF